MAEYAVGGRAGSEPEDAAPTRATGRISIKARLLLYFAALVTVPLVAVSILTTRLYATYIESLILQQKRDLILSSLEEIGMLRSQVEAVADQILVNPVIQAELGRGAAASPLDRLRRILGTETVLDALVGSAGALVIGASGESYRSDWNMGLYGRLPLIAELLQHPRYTESRGGNVWIPLTKDVVIAALEPRDTDRSCLYLVRRIRSVDAPHTQIGVLVLQLDYEPVVGVLRRASRGPGERCVLVDGDATVLAAIGKGAQIGEPLEPELEDGVARAGQSSGAYVSTSGPDGIVQYLRLHGSDWTIVQATPRANLLQRTWQVQRLTILVLAACLAAALAASWVLSRGITQPIARLSGALLAFGSGRLELRAPRDRRDEIGQLQRSFNRMADDMHALMASIEEEHKLRRKLELNMLEYQINPHFLYNILDSINWMAQKAGQPEIGAMVTALARFFRIGLSSGRDHITVGEELEHARYFLIISQMRYRDAFRFEIEADETLKPYRTLKVLLQPLLENSMKHGLDKSRAEGLVKVVCRAEAEDVVFEVRDNGRGMDAQTLAALQDRLERGEDSDTYTGGIGLINIHQRLRLHYGDAYGVELESSPGEGTTVRLRIPRQV